MEVFIKLIHYHTVHSPLGFMTHVTYKLTAKNRDQLRNPTLGNRAWATFTFFTLSVLNLTLMYREYINNSNNILCNK